MSSRTFLPNCFIAARMLQTTGLPERFAYSVKDESVRAWAIARLFTYAGLSRADAQLLIDNPPEIKASVGSAYSAYEMQRFWDHQINSCFVWVSTPNMEEDFWRAISHPSYIPPFSAPLYDPFDMTGVELIFDACSTFFTKELPTRHPETIEHWAAREAWRLISGFYEPVPWNGTVSDIAGHFAHMSLKDKGKVSFTENPEKGARDIQASATKPGRYLTRFYPDLEPAVITRYAAMADQCSTLHFAVTEDEFEDVYTNGPNSCMSHGIGEYASDIHPVRVYAAGDLQLAYLRGPQGNITDRVLVWPEKKIYGRVYGSDNGRIERMLEDIGYVEGSLRGAKLLRITHDYGGLVCPYIDGERTITDHGTYLTIGGEIDASNTNGLSNSEPMIYVADLGEERPESWVHDHCYCCDATEDWFSEPLNEFIHMRGGTYWQTIYVCDDYAHSNGVYSEREGAWVRTEDATPLGDDEEFVSDRYYDQHREDLDEEFGLNDDTKEEQEATTITIPEPNACEYVTIAGVQTPVHPSPLTLGDILRPLIGR